MTVSRTSSRWLRTTLAFAAAFAQCVLAPTQACLALTPAGTAPAPTGTPASVVQIMSPANGSTVAGTVNVSLQMGANVVGCDVFADGGTVGSVRTPPSNGSVPWNTTASPNGSVNLHTNCFQAGGALAGTAAETVMVSNGSPTPTPTTTPTPTPTGTATAATPTPTPTPTPGPAGTPTPTPSPVPSGVWSLAPTATGTGWEFVSPSGIKVCKYAGVSAVNGWSSSGKYTSSLAWGSATASRLTSWGFNAAGQYSYDMWGTDNASHYNGLYIATVNPSSGMAYRDDKAYHIKTVYNLSNNGAGMVCGGSIYAGYQIDAYDPGLQAAFNAIQADPTSNMYQYSLSMQMAYFPEEGDDLFGLDRSGVHQDMGYIVGAQNPSMARSQQGGYTFTDRTFYAKVVGLRDYLANKYGCAGSADPAAGNYCGATAATNALIALNSAWHTSYTTWNTSDTGGLSGIKNGSYASWGSGSGLLDENGQHLIANPGTPNCSLTDLDSWSYVPQIETDLHGFVAAFANVYGQKLHNAIAALPAHPPVFWPGYNGPSNVYTALAPYFDGFWLHPHISGQTTNSVSEVQRIIAAAPGKPLIIADYSIANPDSPYSAYPNSPNFAGFASQPLRGQGMVSFWQQVMPLTDVNGKFVVVGLEHWAYYDFSSENSNFGLATLKDNPYDGSANIANGESGNYGDMITPMANYLRAGICTP